ncbi:MAG: translation initiation factor IF-3, partial [Proteobacteria bacterium]|nr:translation initiation factor IF-3 [Pseudomonadota bacterium]
RPKTDEHDYQTKLNKILQFLDDGDRCKVTVFFRGREIVHKDRGLKMLERVVTDTVDVAKVESRPMSEGRTMTMMLAPVKK